MSIAHFNPTEPVRAPEIHSVVSSPEKHAVYDNENDPSYSLEASLSGAPWTTDAYYRQILGVADTPKELDINVQAGYQHYEKIELLEILVQSPLSPNTDSKTQITTVTGNATIFSFLRPNVSDYFVAKSNLGRKGLFKITSVNRKTHEKESVHNVDYSLIEELEPGNSKLINLDNKVSTTKVFSRARLIENLNPILLKERFYDVRRLGSDFKTIATEYWRSFYRPERGSLFLPGQPNYIYDPFLVTFFNKVVGTDVVPEKQRMIFLSENNDPIYEINTIWRLLETRGLEGLTYSEIKLQMVSPAFFTHVAMSRSAFFANTDFTLYPTEYDRSTHIEYKEQWEGYNSFGFRTPNTITPKYEYFNPSPTTNARGDMVDPSLHVLNVAGVDYPAYNNVAAGGSYIFTSLFFEGVPKSVLEIMLLDYLDRKAISLDQLTYLIKVYPKMPRLEQFYYGPMLMVLIRETMRGSYA